MPGGPVARRLGALAALPALLVPPLAMTAVVRVSTEGELTAALVAAVPGDEILLAPGDYSFVTSTIPVDRPGADGRPISVRAEAPGCARILLDTPGSYTEGFKVSAPWWVFEDLIIEGVCSDHSRCEHAFHVAGDADHFTLRRSILRNFNAQIKANGEDPGGGRLFPDDVLIEANEIYNDTPRNTGNPVTPIDVVGGRRWIVRDNFIHDAAKAGGNGVSYQAFLKGNSRFGTFEGNVVACAWIHFPGGGQARVGLSFGGGGSGPDPICEDGDCSIEHQNGLMRNNIIINCNDVGIYLNEALDCEVHHNTLYANAGIDVRFPVSVVDLRNNLMTGRIRERDGGTATTGSNVQQAGDAAFEAWFADPGRYDFALVGDGSSFVDRGEVVASVSEDFCGGLRDAAPDIGAVEYDAGDCDTPSALSLLPVPDGNPPQGPGASLRVRRGTDPADLVLAWEPAGDVWWNLYGDLDPATARGRLQRPLVAAPSWTQPGVVGDGVTLFFLVRAVEPCTGAEAY